MRRILFVIFLFFILHLNAFAKTGISFIYVNGSDIHNAKINKWYVKGIKRFHPYIKNAFERDPFAQKYFLKCGQYFIETNPVLFFWGDKKYCYPAVPKGFITWLACKIRLTAKNVLHDIIWLQKYNNMNCVLDNLHKTVVAEIKKGNKIVLYGYSSGSFVTYEYLLTRIPYINVADFFNSVNFSKERRDFISQHPVKNTCVAALEQSLGTFSADGHIIINNDFNSFKKSYMNLNEQTDAVCIPCNEVLGMVNIGSPMTLFNPDISAPDFQLTYYNRLLCKYIFENDIFWLTVNYREDPLSFPCERNLTIEEIENIIALNIDPCAGFIYEQSNVRGGILAMTHTAYLSKRKTLSKAIVKAYAEGYRYQCENRCKQTTINKCWKKFNIRP